MALPNLARFNRLALPLAVAATLGLGGIQLVGGPAAPKPVMPFSPVPERSKPVKAP